MRQGMTPVTVMALFTTAITRGEGMSLCGDINALASAWGSRLRMLHHGFTGGPV